ncbi:helix-turn-helix domain-containing protein [Streptomyces sp. NBC_01471]|uniref:helix-turn-helix domain-containing protein n=1 Tax=Streptomyces sp. NBC_01471 TaxID=2903879 RepID=UPI0032504E82
MARAVQTACRHAQTDLKSQKAIAEKLGYAESTLSAYLQVTKIPSPETLDSLWKLVPERAVIKGIRSRRGALNRVELFETWAKAEAARRLRRNRSRISALQAKEKAGARAGGTSAGAQAGGLAAAAHPPEPSARPAVLGLHQKVQLRYHRARLLASRANATLEIGTLTADTVLPVPRSEGDRQHEHATKPSWLGIEELLRHFQERPDGAGARPILDHVAVQYDPSALLNAVLSIRAEGLHPAADSVLTNAGTARSPNSVMPIVAAFLEADRPDDAAILVRASLHRTSS